MMKRCPRCKKQLDYKETCVCYRKRHKERDKRLRNDPYKQFYKTSEWQHARSTVIQHYDGMDIYGFYIENVIEYGHTVHHIVPLEEDYGLRVWGANLIYLTEKNHRAIHRLYKEGDEKKRETQDLLRGLIGRWNREHKNTGENEDE